MNAIARKGIPALLCGFAGFSALQAGAAEWSDTSIGWRYGTKFAEPFNTKDISKNIVSLTHVSGYKYGVNFFNVDLLMSASDAEAFLKRVGVERRRVTGDERFRSQVFGTWISPPLPIEAFGGFELAVGGAWREIALSTREAVTVGGACVFVPSAEELVRLMRSFGRPKDLERARLLERRN